MSADVGTLPPPNTTEQPPAEQVAATPPPVEETGGIKRGNTSALLAKADFTPPAKTTPTTEARSEEGTPAELVDPAATGEVTPPATTPPVEDEVVRLRRENEDYHRQFQEVETARQASQAQALTVRQQNELAQHEAAANATKQAYALKYYQLEDLQSEYATAQSEQDFEAMQALAQSIQTATFEAQVFLSAQTMAEHNLTRVKTDFQNSYDTERTKAQTAAVEQVAKKYGLSLDDLKKSAPDLKVTEYFKVLDTMGKALHDKLSAENAELKKQLKEQETKLREEYRDQFDNSPGAQPHRMNGGTAGAHVDGIKAGNSSKLLEKAFKNL